MSWHSLLAGVDGSPESASAARLGLDIAERAGVPCRLVHAVPDYGPVLTTPEASISLQELQDASQREARRLVCQSLEGLVPPDDCARLEVRVGRGPVVLAEAARVQQSDVVVLGAKRHHALARIGGTTITHLVRHGSVPVLATDANTRSIGRVLAAVDLSVAAKPTIDAAEKWAALFDASLRVIHTSEPLPVVPGFPMLLRDDDHYRHSRDAAEAAITPLVAYPRADIVIRRGRAAAAITDEAQRWKADLIVVGSHGKGWVDRMLIGSTSERLLQVLPASVLVVPVFHTSPAQAPAYSARSLVPLAT